MGSLQLLWFCQEAEMDILNRDGKFEEMMAIYRKRSDPN
jgi:hypothetical protein